jgi:hypothetical protein
VKQPQLVKPRIFDSLQVGGGVRVLAYVIYLETKDIRQSVKSVQGLTRETMPGTYVATAVGAAGVE